MSTNYVTPWKEERKKKGKTTAQNTRDLLRKISQENKREVIRLRGKRKPQNVHAFWSYVNGKLRHKFNDNNNKPSWYEIIFCIMKLLLIEQSEEGRKNREMGQKDGRQKA